MPRPRSSTRATSGGTPSASPATTAATAARRRPSAGSSAASPTTSFTDRAYWFGAGRYEDDRFSTYDFQSSLATGLGYKLIDEERTKLWVQGGPGYRYAEYRATGESEDGLIFRGDLGFEHQLTDTTKIVDRFLIETGSDNTYIQNDLGLEVTIKGVARAAGRLPGPPQHRRHAGHSRRPTRSRRSA